MYGIMRFEKLKTKGELAGAAAHVGRKRPTPNADPAKAKDNKTLHGSVDPVQAVEDRYQATGATKRKNGVLAYEFIITASPEFFREKNEYGHHEVELTEALGEKAVSWLKKEFGEDNVLSVNMHLDEATPHIHAYVTPLKVNKKGKWAQAAKQWTGNKKLCSEMQDRFAEAVSELGLRRGTKGSKAKHTKVKEYYAATNEETVEKIPSLAVKPPASGWSLLTENSRIEYAEEETERIRKRVIPVIIRLRNQAKSAELSRKKELEYKRTAESLQKKANLLTDIRFIDILEVFEFKKNSDKQWIHPDHEAVFSIWGNNIFDKANGWGGKCSIDLAKYLLKSTENEAISFLGHTFCPETAQRAFVAKAERDAKQVVKNVMRQHPVVEKPEPEPEPTEEPEPEVWPDHDDEEEPGFRPG